MVLQFVDVVIVVVMLMLLIISFLGILVTGVFRVSLYLASCGLFWMR
jgi:hypothetical protein